MYLIFFDILIILYDWYILCFHVFLIVVSYFHLHMRNMHSMCSYICSVIIQFSSICLSKFLVLWQYITFLVHSVETSHTRKLLCASMNTKEYIESKILLLWGFWTLKNFVNGRSFTVCYIIHHQVHAFQWKHKHFHL